MKKVAIILLTIAAVIITNQASAQNEKVLVKTLNTQHIQSIQVEMTGEVTVKTWNEDYTRILIHIKHDNAHANLMKVLIAKGRYSVTSNENGSELILSCDDLNQPLVFGNNATVLEETVSYTIMVPKYMEVQQVENQILATK
jgi:hypothetical protein